MSFLVVDADAGTPVGTVRFVPQKGKLTRLAVLQAYRKYGLGKQLVRALEEYAAAGGEDVQHLVHEADGRRVVTVKIHSQVRAALAVSGAALGGARRLLKEES